MQNFNILASLCSCVGWFAPYTVKKIRHKCSQVGKPANERSTINLYTPGLQIRVRNEKSFSYFSIKTYVVGTQRNRLTEHPKHMDKKIIPILC